MVISYTVYITYTIQANTTYHTCIYHISYRHISYIIQAYIIYHTCIYHISYRHISYTRVWYIIYRNISYYTIQPHQWIITIPTVECKKSRVWVPATALVMSGISSNHNCSCVTSYAVLSPLEPPYHHELLLQTHQYVQLLQ